MKIHFVCTGNTFRSRIAEAYLKSKKLKDIQVSSSGIKAQRDLDGAICWYTKKILEKHKIFSFASKNWTQTTKELIDLQDKIIFMSKMHYDFCKNELACKLEDYEIWEVPDVTVEINELAKKGDKKALEEFSERYKKITSKIDHLIGSLKVE